MADKTERTLEHGEVTITLAGEERTLKPTLNAFTRIAARGPYRDTIQALMKMDVGAYVFVLQHGLAMKDAEVKDLHWLIMQTGVTDLMSPLVDYVFRLFNAGKSAEEVSAGSAPAGKPAGGG